MRKQIQSKIAHFGLADSISQENTRRWRLSKNRLEENTSQPLRFFIFYLAIFLVVLVFLVRLFMLMVVGGEENRALAEGNRIKLVEIEPKRGEIFDRNGAILAESKDLYLLKKDSQTSEISQTAAK